MSFLRFRKKPWIPEAIKEYEGLIIFEPQKYRGNWQEIFEKNHPLHLELGIGKGQFITGLAEQNPDINYLGFEVQEQILYYAAKKSREMGLSNIRLSDANVNGIEDFLGPGEGDRIYINFCDPWPKQRHAPRRLTHRGFLEKYKRILKPGSLVYFKTDNPDLFEFSLEEFSEAGMVIRAMTRDLHNSEYVKDNTMTEYEEKFVSRDLAICFCAAQTPVSEEVKS